MSNFIGCPSNCEILDVTERNLQGFAVGEGSGIGVGIYQHLDAVQRPAFESLPHLGYGLGFRVQG